MHWWLVTGPSPKRCVSDVEHCCARASCVHATPVPRHGSPVVGRVTRRKRIAKQYKLSGGGRGHKARLPGGGAGHKSCPALGRGIALALWGGSRLQDNEGPISSTLPKHRVHTFADFDQAIARKSGHMCSFQLAGLHSYP